MKIPRRTATDAYLAGRGVQLDIAFDMDLGELTRGHHIVARGTMLGRPVRVPKRDPAKPLAPPDRRPCLLRRHRHLPSTQVPRMRR
jgi:hypothetical protein